MSALKFVRLCEQAAEKAAERAERRKHVGKVIRIRDGAMPGDYVITDCWRDE